MFAANPSLVSLLPLLALALASFVYVTSKAALKRVQPPSTPPPDHHDAAAEPAAPARVVHEMSTGLRTLTGRARGMDHIPLLVVVGLASEALGRLIPELAAASTPLSRVEQAVSHGTCRIALCPDGAVASFTDGLLDHANWEARWGEFLNALLANRSDQPFDGLVVVLPAERLVGPASLADDALAALGERLYRMIWTAQRDSGWRVPIHVVIGGCEAVTGFAATAAGLSPALRRAPLGWAVPYGLDMVFEQSWVGVGIDALVSRLSSLQARLLMRTSPIGTAEQVLLFPHAVASLAAPLALLLASALRPSAYHQSFIFRGFFLVGRAPAEMASGYAAPDLFAARLFPDRIFPEHMLARPIEGAANRRRRRIRIAQAALAAAALFALFGLSRLPQQQPAVDTVRRLVTAVGDVEHNLRGTMIDVAGANAAASDLDPHSVATEQLLQVMAGVSVDRLETPWAPLSYLSNASDRVVGAIRAGYEIAVLRAVQERLSQTIPQLLGLAGAAASPAGTGERAAAACTGSGVSAADIDRLRHTLAALQEYRRQLKAYQSLPGDPRIGALDSLLQFALRLPLPTGFSSNYHLYEAGLMGAVARPLPILQIRSTVDGIMTRQVTRAVDAAYPGSELAVAVDAAVAAGAATPAVEGSALDRLRSLDTSLKAIARSAPVRDYDWLAAGGLGGTVSGLLDMLGTLAVARQPDVDDLSPVGPNLTQRLRDAAAACAMSTRTRLMAARLFGTEPVLRIAESTVALAPAPAGVIGVLDGFLALPLVASPPGPAAVPGEAAGLPGDGAPLFWDAQQLATLQSMAEGYQTFSAQLLPVTLPPALRALLAAAAGERLDALAQEAIAQALRNGSTRRTIRSAGGNGALREEVARFVDAAPVLTNLRVALRQSGRAGAADQLDGVLADQAQRLLGRVDVLLTSADPYQMVDRTLSFWNGNAPLAAVAFGAASLSDLVGTLPARRDYVEELSRDYAAPLVAYLQQSGMVASGSAAALVGRWSGIADTLARYHRGDPANSLSQLEQFISADMDRIMLANCSVQSAPVGNATDWFGQQLQTIRRAVVARCGGVSHADTAASYTELAGAFNASLAGRFPFGGSDAPDADPGDVKRFFTAFGAQLPDLQARLGNIAAYRRDGAAQFVEQLLAVQAALAPMLTNPAPDAALSYTVTPDFRTNAGSDPGADQIVERSVRIGQQTLSSFDAAHSLAWTAGQPVEVRLRWAANAPAEPASVPDRPGLVEGRLASFRAAGSWALLRLIAQQRPPAGTLAQLNDRRPETVGFTVALQPNPNAAVGGNAGLTSAQAFMRLGLTGTLRTPGQPDKQLAVMLPYFPTAAPLAPSGPRTAARAARGGPTPLQP